MFKENKRWILVLWMSTYLLIGMVSLVVILFSYNITIDIIKKNALENNDALVGRIQDAFDECFFYINCPKMM